MLGIVKKEGQDYGDDAKECETDSHLLLFRCNGPSKNPERLHIAENADKPHYPQNLENRNRSGGQQSDEGRICGQDVNQSVETETIAEAPPESLVFGIKLIRRPYTERYLNREDNGSKNIDKPQKPSIILSQSSEGRKEDLQRTYENQCNNHPVQDIVPDLRVKIVIKYQIKLFLDILNSRHTDQIRIVLLLLCSFALSCQGLLCRLNLPLDAFDCPVVRGGVIDLQLAVRCLGRWRRSICNVS